MGLVNSIEEAAEILEVPIDASKEEIERAFKIKALEFHPDRNPDRDTTAEMQRVISAREVLLNKGTERTSYEDMPYTDITSMSYEDIAKYRKEIGREEFDKRYPGWINEIKREMGLENYNRVFEGYKSQEHNGPEYSDEDMMLDRLGDQLKNTLYEIGGIKSKIKDNKNAALKFIEKPTSQSSILYLNQIINVSEFIDKLDELKNKFNLSTNTLEVLRNEALNDFADYIKKNLVELFDFNDIVFGDNFNPTLFNATLYRAPKEKITMLIDKLKKHPNKIVKDRHGRESINFSAIFDGLQGADQRGEELLKFLLITKGLSILNKQYWD